jgi:putative two-component system response regulator
MSRPELPAILVVDDDPGTLILLGAILETAGYRSVTASSAEEARELLNTRVFSLVLADVGMPGDSGIDLLEWITTEHADTATLMVSGMNDPELAEKALRMGAYGYVIKPFEANEILINVTNALRRRELEVDSRGHREGLEHMINERTSRLWNVITDLEHTQNELRLSREETINRLAIAAEFRDDDTGRHTERMSRYCELIARHAGWDEHQCELLRTASVMHDVGKIGIPDGILLKPSSLTPEEVKIMQTHCEIGHKILSGSTWELLNLAATIALTHHERLDGTGYPQAIGGSDIPLEGRIAAIADVFDALISDRVYRPAFPIEKAVEMMAVERGTHFDPELLDLFMGAMDQVREIKKTGRTSTSTADL